MENLVPPLPLPDAERAAEALNVITQCFQSIAESHTAAESEAAAAATKNTKPSMFSFNRKVAPVLTPTPAAASTSDSGAAPASPVRTTSTQPTAYSTVPVESSKSPRGLNNNHDATAETAASPRATDKVAMTELQAEPERTAIGVDLEAQGESQGQGQDQTQDGQKDQAVQEWEHQQERLSLDQQPVSLAEGFKYW